MSDTNHTPGPWKLRANIDRSKKSLFPFEIHAKSGLRVAVTAREPKGAHIEAANARLIAAAPELLEALERIAQRAFGAGVGTADAVPFVKVPVALLAEARAAIAKAQGRPVKTLSGARDLEAAEAGIKARNETVYTLFGVPGEADPRWVREVTCPACGCRFRIPRTSPRPDLPLFALCPTPCRRQFLVELPGVLT